MPRRIEPTEAERRKEALLRSVARAYSAAHRASPRAVLIGGTALRIAYGLPRPSSDLDYAHRTSGEGLGKREIPEILERMGFKVVAAMPDGKIPIRTNVVIRKAGWRNLLGTTTTIDVDDIRTLEIGEADMVKREGIWTLNIRKLLELKLESIEDLSGEQGKRIAARDLYDMGFMFEKHRKIFTAGQIEHMSSIIERSVYGAARDQWTQAFANDSIMRRSSLVEVADEIAHGIAKYKAEAKQRAGMDRTRLDAPRRGKNR